MFSSFTNRLQLDVNTIKAVLDTHDRLRALIFSSAPGAEQANETRNALEAALYETRMGTPSKTAWQVYDHCAAFTRLYAVYERFVEELVSEYLRLLPELYLRYEELPPTVTIQHRVGVAHILQKLGKDGPYKTFDERSIIQNLAHGITGNPNYKLITDAFLIDPQNYRAEVVARIFSYLGFENSWAWVEKHPSITGFMLKRRDSNETAATLLHDFVEYRNEASHGAVGTIVATDEIKSIADFVVALCDALAQLVMKHAVQRKTQQGGAIVLGNVIHKFSGGIVGAQMSADSIAVGDLLVVLHKNSCQTGRIESIQTQETPHERLDVHQDQVIGLRLSVSAHEGAQLLRLPSEEQPTAALLEPSSPDEFPVGESIADAPQEGDS